MPTPMMKTLIRRVATLEKTVAALAVLEPQPGDRAGNLVYLGAIATAVARGNAHAFPIGRRVRFWHRDWPARVFFTGDTYDRRSWLGTVIPRPAGCRKFGKEGDRLVWVLTDAHGVRGCYPYNLRTL